MADEQGIAVDVNDVERKGLKKLTTTRRYYLFKWEGIVSYQLEQAPANLVGGSTVNRHSSILTVSSADKSVAFPLHLDAVAARNALGKFLGAVDARLAGSSPPAAAPSIADELTKLAGLRDAGVLSDEEFEAQKAKLLS